jgi:hypothetical protein
MSRLGRRAIGALAALACVVPGAVVVAVARYGRGYLLAARDGGAFNFGTRPFFGAVVQEPGVNPITDVVAID